MFAHSRIARCAAVAAMSALSLGVAAASLSAQPMSTADQIASAILALPTEMQADAGVLGYKTGTKLEQLRPAKNGMLCLADDPSDDELHVSCYHVGMEPFMARGRALREGGTKGTMVDSVRFAEVKSGKIKMPKDPATLYQIFAPKGSYSAGKFTGGRRLTVVYIPYATEASTGLSSKSSATAPWLMFPGTPKAHIMFSSSM
ncbi:MAG: hypothetical protein V4617_18390 [Gemmatimonadota bacterium]